MTRTAAHLWVVLLLAGSLLPGVGCGNAEDSGPPAVHVGESVCAECGMIISDKRFATATIIEDERGRSRPILFDDFNCQHNHPSAARPALATWVHDHATSQWIPAEQAFYVHSPGLLTPMASSIAAFEDVDHAEAMADDLGGRVLTHQQLQAGRAAGTLDDGSPAPQGPPAERSRDSPDG